MISNCLRCEELLGETKEATCIVKVSRLPCRTDRDTPLCDDCYKYMKKMNRVKDA